MLSLVGLTLSKINRTIINQPIYIKFEIREKLNLFELNYYINREIKLFLLEKNHPNKCHAAAHSRIRYCFALTLLDEHRRSERRQFQGHHHRRLQYLSN